jgi:DNA-binding CsgD family transcriptional regulator
VVAATQARADARRDLGRLVHRGLDVPDFVRAVTRILKRAVPCEGTCMLTVDPATLLPTGEISEHGLPADVRERLTEIELRELDFNKFTALARAARHAASLSEATEGDLDRSVRQRELRRPSGFADELRAALPGVTGTWGALTLLREHGRPHFSPADVRFVAAAAADLGDGLRRATLLHGHGHGHGHGSGDETRRAAGAGLVVLAADDVVELADDAGERWLDELAVPGQRPTCLPLAIRAVAGRTRAIAGGDGGGAAAQVRVRDRHGRWVVIRGSMLGDGRRARVAVLLEAAGPAAMAPLIADAFGLTERERLVTELVARGLSTNEIAGRLHLSAYTVQDHLKSIFTKSGTTSRGDLVARLFFDHYRPRLTTATPAS